MKFCLWDPESSFGGTILGHRHSYCNRELATSSHYRLSRIQRSPCMVEQARNAIGAAAAGGKDHRMCVDWDFHVLDVLDLWMFDVCTVF